VCIFILLTSFAASALVTNYETPISPEPPLGRRSSLHDMTPSKRERLAVLSNSYKNFDVHQMGEANRRPSESPSSVGSGSVRELEGIE